MIRKPSPYGVETRKYSRVRDKMGNKTIPTVKLFVFIMYICMYIHMHVHTYYNYVHACVCIIYASVCECTFH